MLSYSSSTNMLNGRRSMVGVDSFGLAMQQVRANIPNYSFTQKKTHDHKTLRLSCLSSSFPQKPSEPIPANKQKQDGLGFSQNFTIKSYEAGIDGTASIETLTNYLQETALSHVNSIGLLGDGFGSTPEMAKRNLIWAITKMHVMVDRYPTWGDVTQLHTSVAALGTGIRRDWFSDSIKASSEWVMVNKLSRIPVKIPDEVRDEIDSFSVDHPPMVDEDKREPDFDYKNLKLIRSGLTPKWNDLDMNQHVKNVKYVNWVIESVPLKLLESHDLVSMTLKCEGVCMRDSILQSLSYEVVKGATDVATEQHPKVLSYIDHAVEYQHLLRLEDNGNIILTGWTLWRPKARNWAVAA